MVQKVNIGLKEDTHTKAKIICVLKGITLNDYLAKAVEAMVEKDKEILGKIKDK